MVFSKKVNLIVILLFITLILNGCLSKDKELLLSQTEAYSYELEFYQNTFREINKNFTLINKEKTEASLAAVEELSTQLDLIEKRYSSSDFDEILPCEYAESFIYCNLDAVRLGKSAVNNINEYYQQDSSSSDLSMSGWHGYVSNISNMYSNLYYSIKRLESIENLLSEGKPIK